MNKLINVYKLKFNKIFIICNYEKKKNCTFKLRQVRLGDLKVFT